MKKSQTPDGLELLKQNSITPYLSKACQQSLDELILLDSTTSTNDHLLSLARHHPKQTIACFAEHQTAARGRRGRRWLTACGSNLSLSLRCHFHKDPGEMAGLSLATGVAIVKALQRYGMPPGLQLKWPNDVLWQQQKLGGILSEMTTENHQHAAVVIGIGLNLYIPDHLGQAIDQPWTDIKRITQKVPQRNKLAGLVLDELLQATQLFQQQGLKPFLPTWRELDYLIGQPVKLVMANHEINGIMQGISDSGELILQDHNTQQRRFLSGELSLRPL